MKLWKYVPKWMLDILESKLCSNCNQVIKKSNIIAVGIREVEGSENKTTLYSEHYCDNCNKRFVTSFAREYQESVENICYMLIENIQKQRSLEKSQGLVNNTRSDEISDKEVMELKEFMSQTSSHQEFMRFIDGPVIDGTKPDESE